VGDSYLADTMVPSAAGLPFVGFGVFTILIGLYIGFIAAPDQPTMRDGEEIIDTHEADSIRGQPLGWSDGRRPSGG
jgi:hypothetical protein